MGSGVAVKSGASVGGVGSGLNMQEVLAQRNKLRKVEKDPSDSVCVCARAHVWVRGCVEGDVICVHTCLHARVRAEQEAGGGGRGNECQGSDQARPPKHPQVSVP